MPYTRTATRLAATLFVVISFTLPFANLLHATSSPAQAASLQTRHRTTPAARRTPPAATTDGMPKIVSYRIDAGQSKFNVRAFVSGLLSSFGHDHTIAVRDFSGEVRLMPDTLESASLQMFVNARSLAVVDDVSDKDRRKIEGTMRDEVLEVGKYSEMIFRSTNVQVRKRGDEQYQARITGDLTLHGVTRPVSVDAQVVTRGDTLRASGEFSLRQTDYKVTPPSVGLGTVKVKDGLKLTFDIIARR
ncbi:MAG: YceI family protein [Pyrinomonadaceae bacterium]|nr:YceI family protein [Pyrinomonadaceae bacterium]